MDEWREATLGDLGQIVGGGTPSRDRPDYWDGTIPWLTPGELTGRAGMTVCETAERITELGLASSGARVVPHNTVLVTSRATLGSCALAGCEMATNQGFKNLIPTADSDPRFLYFLMETLGGELTRRASGTTFLEVSGKEFARVAVNMPPLGEQRRIAEILDTIDETIRVTERVIAKLSLTRTGMLDGLMASAVGIHETPLGETVTDPLCYGIVQVGEHVNGGVPVVAIRDLGGAFGPELHRTDPTTDARYPRSRVRGGEVLLSIKGTVGRVGLVPSGFHGNISRDIALVRPASNVRSSFLKLFLESSVGQQRLGRIAVGTTRAELSIHALRRVAVPVPLLPEQERIVGPLSALDERLEVETGEIAKVRAMRIGLAGDLLSGRVRTVAA